jgi:hypothetical protein
MKNILFVLLILTTFQSCGKKESKLHEKKEIDAAMREYDRVLQTVDPDAIADIYDEDGDLGDIAHGRDSIKKFLSTFKDLKVLQQTSSTDNIEILGDSAIQTGSYVQIDVVADKDTITVRGTYKAMWRWDGDAWKIKRMETTPL